MRRLIVVFLIAICTPTISFAWGANGHKAVAQIALAYMSDVAKQEALNLLGTEQEFVDAAIWADQVRFSRPATAPWHFIDIPYSTGILDPATLCRNDDCVIARIKSFSRILADRQLARPVRVEALKWVIHFVGDLHQPLHCADDDDRGGNEVWVRILGKTNKLHSWWDTGLVDELGANVSDIADGVIRDINPQDVQTWSGGTPEQWAGESFKIAHDFIYARSRGRNTRSTAIILLASYTDDATPLISRQLGKAGVRLAWTLNQALR